MLSVKVRVEYVDAHHRVVVIDNGLERLYSIDVYFRLKTPPRACASTLDVGGPARLCYIPVTDNCEAVLVVTPDRVEVVNLRYRAPVNSDPFGGSAEKAREECIERARSTLELVLEGGSVARGGTTSPRED